MAYIFRNTTVENLFPPPKYELSGYNDIYNFNTTHKRYIWFYLLPVKSSKSAILSEIHSFYDQIENIKNRIPENSEFIIFSLFSFFDLEITTIDKDITLAIYEFNQKITAFAKNTKSIKTIFTCEFAQKYPITHLINWKYYFSANIQLNPKLHHEFRDWFERKINQIEFKRKKCLVLDLDNTLWGGIIGEDGPSGICIGGDYPGSAFQLFQESILELKQHGVLLAICSKNNLIDSLQILNNHPRMVLRENDFAVIKSNWNDKASNLLLISKELNIGLDSIVFLDDNPAERALIKQVLPGVSVPEFPQKAYQLPSFILSVIDDYFRTYQLTNEDLNKSQQYQENKLRETLKVTSANFDDYLKSLEIELFIEEVNEYTISRASQMTQKTNQFNLTTKRYSEADIQQKLANGHQVFHLSVQDRFGDHGITGLIIINTSQILNLEIDSFMLSCRILGKEIEVQFLHQIILYFKNKGSHSINSLYLKSNKNQQVRCFYENLGFQITNDSEEKKEYRLLINNYQRTSPNLYKITFI